MKISQSGYLNTLKINEELQTNILPNISHLLIRV